MVVIFSTPTCPRCKILKEKLASKGVMFEENQDVTEMTKLGIDEVPRLLVDNELLDFGEAVAWVNKL